MPLITNETAAIKLTPAQEAEVAKLPSTSAIITYMRERSVEQGLVTKDDFDRTGDDYFSYHPIDTPQPTGMVKAVVIDGVKHIIEGKTEDELVSNELALMRQLFAQPATGTEQQRDSQGRFVSQPTQAELEAEAARVAALNVDPAAAALAPSLTAALQAAGIDVSALRDFTETKRAEAYTQSWTDAATAFGEAHPEFPRSEENKTILGRFISENNLLDAEDKLAALKAAYNFAVENKRFVETTEAKQARAAAEQARQINEAQTPEELQTLLRSKGHLAPIGSNLWGR
jgi:hypothetical protein